jgi:hypothetical protein
VEYVEKLKKALGRDDLKVYVGGEHCFLVVDNDGNWALEERTNWERQWKFLTPYSRQGLFVVYDDGDMNLEILRRQGARLIDVRSVLETHNPLSGTHNASLELASRIFSGSKLSSDLRENADLYCKILKFYRSASIWEKMFVTITTKFYKYFSSRFTEKEIVERVNASRVFFNEDEKKGIDKVLFNDIVELRALRQELETSRRIK